MGEISLSPRAPPHQQFTDHPPPPPPPYAWYSQWERLAAYLWHEMTLFILDMTPL